MPHRPETPRAAALRQALRPWRPVALAPGQAIYPPAGNYVMTLGPQTVLQWWDPVAYSWRNYGYGQETSLFDCDGYNYRLVNMTLFLLAE